MSYSCNSPPGRFLIWDSWEPGAVVMDRDTGVYADGTKVRTIDFDGRYYKCREPLNTVRPPPGRPVFVQAGGSPRGRQFAASYADSIIAMATGIASMKAYRDGVRARMIAYGRQPDDCKVLILVSPNRDHRWSRAGAPTTQPDADGLSLRPLPR